MEAKHSEAGWRSKRSVYLALGGFVAILVLALTACGSDPTATPRPTATPVPTPVPGEPTATPIPAWEVEWNALVEGARAEGSVTISAGRTATRVYKPIYEDFAKRYGIELTMGGGSGSRESARIQAEAEAGEYTVDIIMGGISNGNVLWDKGLLDPVEEWLVLPEVTDNSLWYKNQRWYGDTTGQGVFMFAGSVTGADLMYNTDLVDPDTITSYFDLLKPEWNGKIAGNAWWEPGTLGGALRWYVQPSLGPEWWEKLVLETNFRVAPDKDVLLDWVATGVAAIGFFPGTIEDQVEELKAAGAPIDFMSKTLKEGGILSSGGSSQQMFVPKRPPHPNAAKVLLNHWLSAEGQLAMQNLLATVQSFRTDIPIYMVNEDIRRVPELEYIFPAGEPELNNQREEANAFAVKLGERWRALQ